MKKTFCWEPTLGQATCLIRYKDVEIIGSAQCHDDDEDFMSERTGMFIAESRANIALWQHMKNNEIKPQIQVLEHVMASWRNSKNYNPASFEAKSLRNQIKAKTRDYNELKHRIAMEQEYLRDYIKNKEIVHNKLRNRAAMKDNNN